MIYIPALFLHVAMGLITAGHWSLTSYYFSARERFVRYLVFILAWELYFIWLALRGIFRFLGEVVRNE